MAVLFLYGFWASTGTLIVYYAVNAAYTYNQYHEPVLFIFYSISGIIIILITWIHLKEKKQISNLNSFMYLLLVIFISSIASCITSGIINFFLIIFENYELETAFLDLFNKDIGTIPSLIIGRIPISLVDRITTTLLGLIIATLYKKLRIIIKGIYLQSIIILVVAAGLTLIFTVKPKQEEAQIYYTLYDTYDELYISYTAEEFNKDDFYDCFNNLTGLLDKIKNSDEYKTPNGAIFSDYYESFFADISEYISNIYDILQKDSFKKEELSRDMFYLDSYIMDVFYCTALQENDLTDYYRTFFWILIPVVLIVFALLLYYSFGEIKKQKENLEESKKHLSYVIKAQEDERSKMARELHDTLAQDMRYVNLLANQIDDENLKSEIKTHQTECINHLRNLCSDYSAPDIISTGLIAFLHSLILDFKKRTNCECNLIVLENVDFSDFNNNQLLNIYRIIQEALQNIIKHANATEVSILIRCDSDDNGKDILKIIITDDGVGIDSEILEKITNSNGLIAKEDGNHFGMKNMKERVEYLNGSLKIDSLKNEGTELIISLPK